MTPKRKLVSGLSVRESEIYHDLRRLHPETPERMIWRQAITVAAREERAHRQRRSWRKRLAEWWRGLWK